ncbi:MAG: hypothetical protein GF308_12765 [Candidatus Heimdallarchaeota archaeon]|nr:hypothetical protein [Candidatus Heimdallarchaeota archaeon]
MSDKKAKNQDSLNDSSVLAQKSVLEEDNSTVTEGVEEEIDEDSAEESWIKRHLPKWARITLMIAPALVLALTVILIDYYIDLKSKGIFPMSILAVTSIALIGFATLGELVYRNFFVTRMLRHESKKARVYKQIIQERQEEQELHKKYEFVGDEETTREAEGLAQETSDYQYEDEYEYDDEYNEEEEEGAFAATAAEYEYEVEDPYDEKKYYQIKSLILRGGIFTMILTNGLILIVLAVLLQMFFYGGFITPPSE